MLFVKVWCICFMMFSREAMDTAGYKSRITDIRSNIRCGRIPDICITDSKLLFDETYFNTFHELTLCSLYNNCTLVLSSLRKFLSSVYMGQTAGYPVHEKSGLSGRIKLKLDHGCGVAQW